MRLALALVLSAPLAFAAPVPKMPPPEGLTPAKLIGTYDYA
jgi:hypothetical protein